MQSLTVSFAMPEPENPKVKTTRGGRMFDCATELQFAIDGQGTKKLRYANFCKDRMCPMCQKRRSLKIYHDLQHVCGALIAERPTETAFLMLTLTVPNVHHGELRDMIKHMLKSWDRLMKRKEIDDVVLGWFRSLEVTQEKKRQDHFHPHIHALIAVPGSYFKTKHYIKQHRWQELWGDVTLLPVQDVDVRRIKARSKKSKRIMAAGNVSPAEAEQLAIRDAAAETGKYATKPSDYIRPSGIDGETEAALYTVNKEVIQILAEALKNHRLIAYGKRFKSLLAADAADDNADLVHIDGEKPSEIEAVAIQRFAWVPLHLNYIN